MLESSSGQRLSLPRSSSKAAATGSTHEGECIAPYITALFRFQTFALPKNKRLGDDKEGFWKRSF
jgi:hypothetical protein